MPILLLGWLFLLGGCASVYQERLVTEARERDVPFDLIVKMRRGDQLDIPDLEILARQRVPDALVIDYLLLTEARYFLTETDAAHMRAIGISPFVIDYLRSTPERFKYRYPRQWIPTPPRRAGPTPR